MKRSLLLLAIGLVGLPSSASALQCGATDTCASAPSCDTLSPGSPCGSAGEVCAVVDVDASWLPWNADEICCACEQTSSAVSVHSGPAISDQRLARLLNTHVPTASAHSAVLVLTQCFGGDMLDDFAARPNTVVLSGTTAGEVAIYGGYDQDAAGALWAGPGRTSGDVHAAGVAGAHEQETPLSQGGTVTLEDVDPAGAVRSRHVLVFAGQPNSIDAGIRDTVLSNFAGDANTTVTTVGAGGVADGWQFPGTLDGLVTALRTQIAPVMNANEQFIL
ncbi:MAG: hypothetical protein VX498_07700, partial [Myxococcota bacterium]|nr:hypothetical protein [Myxococcota bacterium]